MSDLADLIESKCDAIADQFAAALKQRGAATSLPDDEVINSLREFLLELAEALRSTPGPTQRSELRSQSATSHGLQRFELGYDIGAMVREYGTLRELLFELIKEHGVSVSIDDVGVVTDCFVNGMADAATRYGVARDEQLRRNTAEHVGFLAHELRNPLSSMKLALEIMRKRGDFPSSSASKVLERNLERLTVLVDDALVTVRLDQSCHLDLQPLDVRAFLNDIALESGAELEAKEQRIDVEGDGLLQADPKVLRSAVANLVHNAVKFSHPGGCIHLRAKRGDGRVVIEVEDACGGLPPNATQKLFDPFVQVGMDRSGFGLGLAIAKQAAQAHGGELRVHDLPGKGCVFLLDLPGSQVR